MLAYSWKAFPPSIHPVEIRITFGECRPTICILRLAPPGTAPRCAPSRERRRRHLQGNATHSHHWASTSLTQSRARHGRARTRGRGCEPLGDTQGLTRPSGALHSCEHAGERALWGRRGIRRRNATREDCTQRYRTQLGGTLTRRNATRYAIDATLTRQVPPDRRDICGQLPRHLRKAQVRRHPWGPRSAGRYACRLRILTRPPIPNRHQFLSSRYAHTQVPFVFRE